MKLNQEVVLITGASSGIGLELARVFASQGYSLVLVATRAAELKEIASQLALAHGVKVDVIAKDLEDPKAPLDILATLEKADLQVEILVNNAGIGHRSSFADENLETSIRMIRVNVEALVRMTRIFLPGMLKRGSGRILNTASVASFQPGPSMAIYHATKAFVLSFSESLATELEDKGVTVTALCPGAVDTDFFPKADLTDSRVFQKTQVMAPQEVAQAGYEACLRGERIFVPGLHNKAAVWLRHVLPESLIAKATQYFYADQPDSIRQREPGEIERKAAW